MCLSHGRHEMDFMDKIRKKLWSFFFFWKVEFNPLVDKWRVMDKGRKWLSSDARVTFDKF